MLLQILQLDDVMLEVILPPLFGFGQISGPLRPSLLISLGLLSCARPLRAQATYFLLLLCLHECYPCLGRCRQHAQRALDTCSILAAKLLIANAEAGKFLSAACVGASTEQNIACAHAMIELTFGLQL